LSPQDIWRLSLDAYKSKQNWMEVMATTPKFVPIHEWLTARAQDALTLELEPMIDKLIGKPEESAPENPYFSYFFSPEALKENPAAYLQCLGALRAVRARLREYKASSSANLRSYVDFVELHRRLNMSISLT